MPTSTGLNMHCLRASINPASTPALGPPELQAGLTGSAGSSWSGLGLSLGFRVGGCFACNRMTAVWCTSLERTIYQIRYRASWVDFLISRAHIKTSIYSWYSMAVGIGIYFHSCCIADISKSLPTWTGIRWRFHCWRNEKHIVFNDPKWCRAVLTACWLVEHDPWGSTLKQISFPFHEGRQEEIFRKCMFQRHPLCWKPNTTDGIIPFFQQMWDGSSPLRPLYNVCLHTIRGFRFSCLIYLIWQTSKSCLWIHLMRTKTICKLKLVLSVQISHPAWIRCITLLVTLLCAEWWCWCLVLTMLLIGLWVRHLFYSL